MAVSINNKDLMTSIRDREMWEARERMGRAPGAGVSEQDSAKDGTIFGSGRVQSPTRVGSNTRL
jgi:hypothetical protein